MKRFFGLMPSDCIEISRNFKDGFGLGVTIEAGPKGWTIMYVDHSVEYRDEEDTSENNFKKAYDIAVDAVGSLKEI